MSLENQIDRIKVVVVFRSADDRLGDDGVGLHAIINKVLVGLDVDDTRHEPVSIRPFDLAGIEGKILSVGVGQQDNHGAIDVRILAKNGLVK